MANDYAALADVQAAVPSSGIDDSAYDAIITALITRASRLIDGELKRMPGAFALDTDASQVRYFTGSGKAIQWIDEMAGTPSELAVAETGGLTSADYTVYSSSDYWMEPVNASQWGRPYLSIHLDILNGAKVFFPRYPKSVKVTGPFGYAYTGSTPDTIVQAAIIQTVRWFKRGQQGFEDTGAIADLGQLRYTKALDPEVKELLNLPEFQVLTI